MGMPIKGNGCRLGVAFLRKGEALRSVTCMQLDYAEMGRAIARKLMQGKGIAPAVHEKIAAGLHVGTTTTKAAGRI